MNYRPYPDVDRARHQMERGRVPEPSRCPICNHFVSRHALEGGQPVCTRGQGPIPCRDCAELWARTPAVAAFMNFGLALRHGTGRYVLTEHPRRTGKTVTAAVIADQAVKAGEHAHVASRDGMPCSGGDEGCSLPRVQRGDKVVVEHDGQRARYEVAGSPFHDHQDGQPVGLSVALRPVDGPTAGPRCPGCGHAQHAPGTGCEAGIDHGPNRWHGCLCLATPGASRSCPPQMDCQGGSLGYADIVHLREGRSLRGVNGETITPDVLAEPSADTEGIVAYRSRDGRQLRCLAHAPDPRLVGLDWFPLVDAEVEGDASTCTERGCGTDVLVDRAQQHRTET